ncbi:MAG TPA: RbsD/FucU family protein [Pirellulales bacterium]|nr:RbsD/FucU family protein [Pirellulales bacterium]
MLKYKLLHGPITEILAGAGHHAKVLIADGNYPSSTARGADAEVISLALSPGLVNCTQVLEALVSAVPIEAANTMAYETTGPYALQVDPPVWAEYRRVLAEAKLNLKLDPIEKWAFYEAVRSVDHVLTIQTADEQRFANLLLTIGVRM